MFSGSFSPGTWTRMRSSPWRWIDASRVPSWSMRRRTTSIDWSTADLARSVMACGSRVSEKWPVSSTVASNSRTAPEPKPTVESRGLTSFSFSCAKPFCVGSVSVNTTRLPWTPMSR